MSEMAERVARAMVMAAGFDPDAKVHHQMTRVEAYMPLARAAIAEIQDIINSRPDPKVHTEKSTR